MRFDAVFLFETTGLAALPFTERGLRTCIVDLANSGSAADNPFATRTYDWNILEREDDIAELCFGAAFVFGFPPCDDLTVTGAKHFEGKRDVNPDFQKEALHLFRSVERIGEKAGLAWCAENPRSVVGRLWRRPNHWFHPWMYGGWLPSGDVHPLWPDYIPSRDCYNKQTFLWRGGGFQFPPQRIAGKPSGYAEQHLRLGGSQKNTKRIRSASPRGFFTALRWQYFGV